MIFKKEFDIDKDFFESEEQRGTKRKVALRVFIFVMLLTFGILCYSAFTFNFNTKFGSVGTETVHEGLKEAQEYFFDAIGKYDDGNYNAAIESLNKQLAIVEDPDAYSYLAKIYLEQGDTQQAVNYFKKALEFKPDFFEANLELGKIYYNLRDYRNASKYLTKAASIQTDDIELLSLTAETYKLTGRADDAIILFEKIIELEPENAFATAKIGEVYFQRLQYKKAIPYYEDSLQISFDENAAIQLAKCYFELGSLESAKSIADEILETNRENKQAQSLKTAVEYKMGILKKNKSENTDTKTAARNNNLPPDPALVTSYVREIELPIKTNWTPPQGSNLKKASVKFTVNSDGELVSNVLYSSSGMVDFDKSALDAIDMSKPFPPLPEGLNCDTLDIIFTFDFNIKG